MSTETNLTISPDAVVIADAILHGRITIGPCTIIHPKAKIDAKDGEIIIGGYNIVEETAIIENMQGKETMFIGNDNLFEIGSVCQAKKVGDCNVFGIKCIVGPKTEISDGCRVGAKCKVLSDGEVHPLTVIHFENMEKTALEKPSGQKSQAEFLKRLLPKYSLSLQNSKK
uniref:Dynactin subunit 6 n=1 Tax=Ditylenchus dipsaci TaxID=166011 RepID=A0A915CN48_9BILA